jgi:hypothetical protein
VISAQTSSVKAGTCGSHDSDDFLGRRRVRWVASALVAGWPTGVVAGEGYRLALMTSAVENEFGRETSSCC